MKRKVCILVADAYLRRKLELIFSDVAIFTSENEADTVFTDVSAPTPSARRISVGRGEGYTLRIPFSDEDALSFLPTKSDEGRIISVIDGRIFLGADEIRLTELEGALFMKLYRAGGEFVSREELFSVFADGASAGMLNVYVHYLREKLERDGVRVIISSRKLGYKIDEKFFK